MKIPCSHKRRAVSSIIGMMIFMMIFIAALAVIVTEAGYQSQTSQVQQQAQLLINQKGKEALLFVAGTGGVLEAVNAGQVTVTIVQVVLLFANGTVYDLTPVAADSVMASQAIVKIPSLIPSQVCGLYACSDRYSGILSSTNINDGIGLVTSLGNTFWVRPAQAVQLSDPLTTFTMVFDAVNDFGFGSNTILTLDGTNYQYTQLPLTVVWFAGTNHTYAFKNSGNLSISYMTGYSTASSGSLVASASGTIRAVYNGTSG